MKFDVSFYWFSSWEFCHISDSTAMSGKTNGIAKQNWFRHFSTKPFTLEIPLNQLLNVIAFSGCFKHLSQNEYMIYNYTTSRKEPHSSHSCNSLEFVALPNLPYCIFFLYFCYLTGRVLYNDLFNFMLGGSYVFWCHKSYLNFPHQFCPSFHIERIKALACPIMHLSSSLMMNWTLIAMFTDE